MPVDINRATTGVYLPKEIASEIWAQTQEDSIVMQLAQYMPLPGQGASIPIISGDPVANWVGETNIKPVSRPTLDNKAIQGYTLATIVPFSNQFRRDLDSLYNACVQRLPGVLAAKFDATIFGPSTGAPGANFDTLGAATSVSIATNTYQALVTAKGSVATAGGYLNGWAIAPQGEIILLGAVDTVGRPLFINSVTTEGAVGSILAAPAHIRRAAYVAGTPPVVGFGGDWSKSSVGSVFDNARMESWFATLKKEKLYKINTRTMSMAEVKTVIFRYIHYYNLRRIYTTNGGYPPEVYRQMYFNSLAEAA